MRKEGGGWVGGGGIVFSPCSRALRDDIRNASKTTEKIKWEVVGKSFIFDLRTDGDGRKCIHTCSRVCFINFGEDLGRVGSQRFRVMGKKGFIVACLVRWNLERI